MTDHFITQLLADIEAQRKRTDARIRSLVPAGNCEQFPDCNEFPLQAWMGTVWARSESGSVIEFYNYIDPAYVHGPMYMTEDVHITHGYFHSLARSDRAFFSRWKDFSLYDTESFHTLLHSLVKAGFTILIDPVLISP